MHVAAFYKDTYLVQLARILLYYAYTVESRDYAPLVHASIGQNRGEAYTGWAKHEKNYEVRHNMTQMSSLLAI